GRGRGQPMALWDPALDQLDPGVVTQMRTSFSTRTVRVVAEEDGQDRSLECGPGHPLLIQRPSGIEPRRAKDLEPPDRPGIAPPGSTRVEFWPIKSVTPAFSRGVTLYHLDGRPEGSPLDPNIVTDASAAFGYGIAFSLASA